MTPEERKESDLRLAIITAVLSRADVPPTDWTARFEELLAFVDEGRKKDG